MKKIFVIGKFWKDSNGCASFSLPQEQSKLIDYKKKYMIEVHGGEVLSEKVIKRRGDPANKIVIMVR